MKYLVLFLFVAGCVSDPSTDTVDYRQEMRNFVTGIAVYAGGINSSFVVIPQNGQELVTDTGNGDGTPEAAYIQAIDAVGREDMFFGYNEDDQPTPAEEKQHMFELCLLCEENGVEVLTTDYCFTHSKMDESYQLNQLNGFISFAADHRDLNNIPDYPAVPFNENGIDVTCIQEAQNFLYLINGENYNSAQSFADAVSATNYDAVIIDLFHNETVLTTAQIDQMKTKANGGIRLVICYVSIGEAEDYRYYWQSSWNSSRPAWLLKENPDWAGNYKVMYWHPDWQNIIYGNENSYLKMILDAGFDGVYLDLIDAFEYFEEGN